MCRAGSSRAACCPVPGRTGTLYSTAILKVAVGDGPGSTLRSNLVQGRIFREAGDYPAAMQYPGSVHSGLNFARPDYGVSVSVTI